MSAVLKPESYDQAVVRIGSSLMADNDWLSDAIAIAVDPKSKASTHFGCRALVGIPYGQCALDAQRSGDMCEFGRIVDRFVRAKADNDACAQIDGSKA